MTFPVEVGFAGNDRFGVRWEGETAVTKFVVPKSMPMIILSPVFGNQYSVLGEGETASLWGNGRFVKWILGVT